MRSGYHQIIIMLGDGPKNNFITYWEFYEFRFMSFGLTNAPKTFQCVMNKILCLLIHKGFIVYFDDILIYSHYWKSHINTLRSILSIFLENHFYAKEIKCEFAMSRVEFLGFIVSQEGASLDPKKVESIKKWKEPYNFHEL